MSNHYFKSPVVKMGVWSLTPGDCETWHGEYTSRYFKRLFGIPKESILLYEFKTGFQHAYVTKKYLRLLHSQIDRINRTDYRALSKKLSSFYPLAEHAKKIAAKKYPEPKKQTNRQLAQNFFRIRDRIHHLAIFDQFSWLAEEYWTPKMEKVLVKKLGLEKNSPEYNRVLFTLTKPERISTTLLEKKAVIGAAIRLKEKRDTLKSAAKNLAKQFGFLPIFCFGEPWQAHHYENELKQTRTRPLKSLKMEYQKLQNYARLRNKELAEIIGQYNLGSRDLQIFLDFGLAIDTRNEAEYFVGFGGYYLLPLYKEIARRLYLTTTQVCYLTEKEMLNSVLGRTDPQKILAKRRRFIGWGFSRDFSRRINFTESESEKLFKHIESYVKPVQGGNESQGTCASPGQARGKARLVSSPQQNHKVKTGDILFTYATTTDYLPAMKRAAAIVTEVGGLTCHAAVVSREFGIPCVVALANAMKNFKDGELVEINADKGTVKKL